MTRPNWVYFGDEKVKTTFCSPQLLPHNKTDVVFLCPYCHDSSNTEAHMSSHMSVCAVTRPPGTEVYKEEQLSFFKDDSSSLLAKRLRRVGKSFIPDKVVVEEVDEYDFFVLFKRDQAGLNQL